MLREVRGERGVVDANVGVRGAPASHGVAQYSLEGRRVDALVGRDGSEERVGEHRRAS